jgi:hypothetical protein
MSKNNMLSAIQALASIAKEMKGDDPTLTRLYNIIRSELPSLEWSLYMEKSMDKIIRYYHVLGKSIGLVSAWKGKKYSDVAQNLERQWQLKQNILNLGYGYFAVESVWKNRDGYAFFVPNITKKDAVELGRKWEQEYVLWTEGDNVLQISMNGKEEILPIDRLRVLDSDIHIEQYSALKRFKERIRNSDAADQYRLLSVLEVKKEKFLSDFEKVEYDEQRETTLNYYRMLREYIESDFTEDKHRGFVLVSDILKCPGYLLEDIKDTYIEEKANSLAPGNIIYMFRKAGGMIGFLMPVSGLFRVLSVGDDNIDVSDTEEFRGYSQAERIRTEVFEAGKGSERKLITH